MTWSPSAAIRHTRTFPVREVLWNSFIGGFMLIIRGGEGDTKTKLQKDIEEEITAFDTGFQRLGNAPLVRSEKALIRTFLVARLTDRVSSPQEDAKTSRQ